jgi:phage gp46-like protein
VLCGNECQIPGLEYEDHEDPYPDQSPPPGSRGYRTIKNDEWLLGLILNILNTRARTDLNCPSPAAVYGHWSESYREDGLWIGSRLWNAADKSYTRTSDAVKAIEAAIKADMAKLVMMGVADSVEVEATYRRHSTVEVIVTAIKTNARHVLNLSGTFVSDTWVWH